MSVQSLRTEYTATVGGRRIRFWLTAQGKIGSTYDLEAEKLAFLLTPEPSGPVLFLLCLQELVEGDEDPPARLAKLMEEYRRKRRGHEVSHPLAAAAIFVSATPWRIRLRASTPWALQFAIISHPQLAGLKRDLARLTRYPDIAQVLALSSESATRRLVASNPALPEDMLRRLLQDADPSVRYAAGRHPGAAQWADRMEAPDETAQSGRQDSSAMLALARHTPRPDIIEQMASSDNPALRRAVALNRHLDEGWLVRLSQDLDWSVRASVARRPQLPGHLGRHLAHDLDPRVRVRIAGRRSLPQDLVIELAGDEDETVRYTIAGKQMSQQLVAALLEHPQPKARMLVLRGWSSEAVQMRLAQDPATEVRVALASSDSLSDSVFKLLAQDHAPEVRLALAAKRDLGWRPARAVQMLAKDADERVVRAVIAGAAGPAAKRQATRWLASMQRGVGV